jgi:hypothetical protein
MEVEKAAKVSAPETAELKLPHKTPVRKHILVATNAHEATCFPCQVPQFDIPIFSILVISNSEYAYILVLRNIDDN